jgi:hypothetical protein
MLQARAHSLQYKQRVTQRGSIFLNRHSLTVVMATTIASPRPASPTSPTVQSSQNVGNGRRNRLLFHSFTVSQSHSLTVSQSHSEKHRAVLIPESKVVIHVYNNCHTAVAAVVQLRVSLVAHNQNVRQLLMHVGGLLRGRRIRPIFLAIELVMSMAYAVCSSPQAHRIYTIDSNLGWRFFGHRLACCARIENVERRRCKQALCDVVVPLARAWQPCYRTS